MTGDPIAVGSPEFAEAIDAAYDEQLLAGMDVVERDDFYGIVAWKGLAAFSEKMALAGSSRVLDLCSGIGGPARYLARRYGCRVTGVDLSAFNHRTAVERTRAAGLDGLVGFRQGDALGIDLPAQSFTHVFGCEAWCYFPDKLALYRSVHRLLVPGGTIAFLESACERPLRLHAEELVGPVRYESVADYAAMLRDAGFAAIEPHDTTDLAIGDVARSIGQLMRRRDRVIEVAGEEVYRGLLEIWAEFLALFSERRLTHCGFVARKA